MFKLKEAHAIKLPNKKHFRCKFNFLIEKTLIGLNEKSFF